MTNRLIAGVFLATLYGAIPAQAGPCTLGSVCWTDLSGGAAVTELRFRSEGLDKTVTVGKGRTSFAFADLMRAVPGFSASWLCVYGRQRADDGRVSSWYISDSEGVCHDPNVVMPPVIVVPPPPAPVPPAPLPTPPAPIPPPAPVPPASEIFSDLSNREGVLSFSYKTADCPRGVQQSIGALVNGQRTITLKCRR